MESLGIHHMASEAENSSFILNGEPHSSYSNTFLINNTFELTLNGISPEHTPAKIGFKTSVDAVADNLQELVDAYKGFIDTGERYSNGRQGDRLLRDVKNVAYSYMNDLEAIGMVVNENGSISIDKSLLADAVDTKDIHGTFSVLNSFKNSLAAKANNVSVDPIQYVDKLIVTYKRPHPNFPSPYHTSLYSGMILDHYC